MAYIESAYYGDERSQRNATNVLRNRVLGTTIDIDVNDQLIPPFEITDKASLDEKDEKKIRSDASKACGGVDQACIERTESRLRQDALAEKQKQGNSAATAIKGRRLTVNIIDEKGQRKRIVIPDNQKFKMDNITVNDPKKGPLQVPSADYIQNQMKLLGGLTISALVYVFSVAVTYVLMMQTGGGSNFMVAIPATVIAVFIPYSGYVIIFLYFMFFGAVETYLGNM
jgi:hypothetical protein